jgi:hypothetical protein
MAITDFIHTITDKLLDDVKRVELEYIAERITLEQKRDRVEGLKDIALLSIDHALEHELKQRLADVVSGMSTRR